jgi:hypothetical protein
MKIPLNAYRQDVVPIVCPYHPAAGAISCPNPAGLPFFVCDATVITSG